MTIHIPQAHPLGTALLHNINTQDEQAPPLGTNEAATITAQHGHVATIIRTIVDYIFREYISPSDSTPPSGYDPDNMILLSDFQTDLTQAPDAGINTLLLNASHRLHQAGHTIVTITFLNYLIFSQRFNALVLLLLQLSLANGLVTFHRYALS